MGTYKQILVAVDLSETVEAVMKTAVELGRALQANLLLVHIHKVHAGDFVEGGLADAVALDALGIGRGQAKLAAGEAGVEAAQAGAHLLAEQLVADRKSTRLKSSHPSRSRMPSSA